MIIPQMLLDAATKVIAQHKNGGSLVFFQGSFSSDLTVIDNFDECDILRVRHSNIMCTKDAFVQAGGEILN